MKRVCVLGGGTAGVEAAIEAANSGSKVTLLESSRAIPSHESSWEGPSWSIGPESPGTDILESLGVEVLLNDRVTAVESNHAVVSSSGRRSFDSIVVATGARPSLPPVLGWRTPGVFALDSRETYAELRDAVPRAQAAVVFGPSLASLFVASRLSDAGLKVSVLSLSGLQRGALEGGPGAAVLEAAEENGISFIEPAPMRAVGSGKLEAVVVGGSVVQCDCLVVLPHPIPALPVLTGSPGPHGGMAVDETLRSQSQGVFGAGDCVEYRLGATSIPMMRHTTAAASGRVAGANAAGRSLSFCPIGSLALELFGLELSSAGLSMEESRAAGFEPLEASAARDGLSIRIVFERATRRVLGLQSAGRGRRALAGAMVAMLSRGTTLRELVYSERPDSTDISLLAEAASEGLSCPRF